jgi:carbamoyltransferase
MDQGAKRPTTYGLIMDILGISAFYHDSAACLIRDGRILAAAQEERFSRKKHDAGFPSAAIRFCLEKGGVGLADIDHVVFYDKPLLKFERLLETYLAYAPAPGGLRSFLTSMPVWLNEKLNLKSLLRQELAAIGTIPEQALPQLLFAQHHQSHAASAFFPIDGVGEWATTTLASGGADGNRVLEEIRFPDSLGLLYGLHLVLPASRSTRASTS